MSRCSGSLIAVLLKVSAGLTMTFLITLDELLVRQVSLLFWHSSVSLALRVDISAEVITIPKSTMGITPCKDSGAGSQCCLENFAGFVSNQWDPANQDLDYPD